MESSYRAYGVWLSVDLVDPECKFPVVIMHVNGL